MSSDRDQYVECLKKELREERARVMRLEDQVKSLRHDLETCINYVCRHAPHGQGYIKEMTALREKYGFLPESI